MNQYGNIRVVNQQNVSPIMTSSKVPPKLNYNSVNIHLNPSSDLNMSNKESNNNSGSSTPSHVSQQNLIKIMKKIKSSNSNSQTDKENITVAPPNIIQGH